MTWEDDRRIPDQAVFEQVLRLDLSKICALLRSSGAMTLAPKPIEPGRAACRNYLSRPVNAPPHDRISAVSTCRYSCCGCLRPPSGGTLADRALQA